MFRYRRFLAAPVFALLALLAIPSFAYTVILKDGSRIQTKKKYRISGDKAIVTLVNGQDSFLLLAQIDVPATDRENQNDYGGNAVVIDSGKPQSLPPTPPPAPAQPGNLAELIKRRQLEAKVPEPKTRPQSSAATTAPPRPPSFYEVPAGKTGRRPFPNTGVTDALAAYLRGQGIEEFRLYAGSKGGRVLIEATAASEASAFKAISVAANALLEVKPKEVAAVELVMATPTGERAGSFLITPEQAGQLTSNKIEVSAFYVQNVQF